MSSVIEKATSGITLDPTKPMDLVTKLPKTLLAKVLYGMKLGGGLGAILVGILLIIALASFLASKAGFSLSGFVQKERQNLGV